MPQVHGLRYDDRVLVTSRSSTQRPDTAPPRAAPPPRPAVLIRSPRDLGLSMTEATEALRGFARAAERFEVRRLWPWWYECPDWIDDPEAYRIACVEVAELCGDTLHDSRPPRPPPEPAMVWK